MDQMTKWILDAGHGGMAFGHYMTKGKRSPEVPPGIYEGAFNREIMVGVAELIRIKGIECCMTDFGPLNVPLKARVDFINELHFQAEDLAVLSIHANASGVPGWSSASGSRVFTCRRPSKGTEQIAELLEGAIDAADDIPYERRPTKTHNYSLLYSTKCPAVLIETGFMTNRGDAEFLASADGKAAWIKVLYQTIIQYEELKR